MTKVLLVPVVFILAISAQGQPQEERNSTKSAAPAAGDPSLRREILAMVKEDQDTRAAVIKALAEQGIRLGDGEKVTNDPARLKVLKEQTGKLDTLDERNRTRLEQIVNRSGWPCKTLVGKDGANGAWLLVQHADGNLPFQKRCLTLMRAAPRGEVDPKHLAYLTDRVLTHENKKQIYGTQLHDEKGKLVPDPIADEANVDKLRADVGLPPLAEYLKTAQGEQEKLRGKPDHE
jgi:hypothetical protein